MVRFGTGYEDGRWCDRNAKTMRTWFITEPPLRDEVALEWTDNRAQPMTRNVAVSYLLPSQPRINQLAIIIDGANTGEVCNVVRRIRPSKLFLVQLMDSAARVQLPEAALCRLADPERGFSV